MDHFESKTTKICDLCGLSETWEFSGKYAPLIPNRKANEQWGYISFQGKHFDFCPQCLCAHALYFSDKVKALLIEEKEQAA